MTSRYVSTHNHSFFSFLDGLSSIDRLVERAVELEYPAVGLTDHGSLAGIIPFYKKCKEKGIKSLLGQEFYFTPDLTLTGKPSEVNSHLIVFAKNEIGYRNLLKLTSCAFIDNFYYKPRVTVELLDKFRDGLIITSACMSSPFFKSWHSSYSLSDNLDKWNNAIEDLISIFSGSIYFETQPYDSKEQREYNEIVRREAKNRGVPLICATDAHYSSKKDFAIHNTLLAMQTRSLLSDPETMHHDFPSLYLHSDKELLDLGFPEIELQNTLELASRCDVSIDMSPKFPKIPGAFQKLESECYEELDKKYIRDTDKEKYLDRVKMELSVIKKTGFSDYFLILSDILKYAKSNLIMCGPARGSSAGSLVCNLLGITEVDPIKYGLIFERFMNENRVDPPDVDVDIEDERRGEVIDYIIRKFGRDKTANICTIGKMGVRQAVKDYCFVNGMDFQTSNLITSKIPWNAKTLDEAIKSNPSLKFQLSAANISESDINQFVGMPRQPGTHAAAMVISPDDITNHVPLMKIHDNIVTMYDKESIEAVGLVKFDILGLKNLTTIRKTFDLLQIKNVNTKIVKQIMNELNDKAVFDYIAQGNTLGCFQIETKGITGLCKALPVESFEDIAHVITLYRPAILETPMLELYLANRKNPSNIKYIHKDLIEITRDTYGILLYQENLLAMVRKFAGFSLTEADEVRKGVARKKPEIIKKIKSKFIKGCIKNSYSKNLAEELFQLIEAAERYSFNFSHAISYATTSYHTAYLKFYYPVEFMVSLLNCESDEEKLNAYIQEAKNMNIKIHMPDINISSYDHKIENNREIRLGLKMIKGIGARVSEFLDEDIEKKGQYTDIKDFIKRYNGSLINSKAFLNMIKVGCFDSLGIKRSQLLQMGTKELMVIEAARKFKKERERNWNLEKKNKPLVDIEKVLDDELKFDQTLKEVEITEVMSLEKEGFGFYLSNEMEKYKDILLDKSPEFDLFRNYPNGKYWIAGIIQDFKEFNMKKGGVGCRFSISTPQGEAINCTSFAADYLRSKPFIKIGLPVFVYGKYNAFKGNEGLIVSNIMLFSKENLELLLGTGDIDG